MNRDALGLLSKDDLIDLVLAQEARLATLERRLRLATLERRLGLNSENSSKPPSSDGLNSKPPSSDGLNKPPAGKNKGRRTTSLREKSGRKPGGQKGHKGWTLRQVAEPDRTADHFPEVCRHCGSSLSAGMATGYGARQVFDLPEPRPLVAGTVARP
jgi:transposase